VPDWELVSRPYLYFLFLGGTNKFSNLNLINIEADESEKYKHLSTQATNEFLCFIGN